MRIFCVILLLVGWLPAMSQYLDFLKADHEWPADLRVPLAVNEQYQAEDVVILYEKLGIQQNFRQARFQEITFEKHLLIKYNSQTGVGDYGELVLPMSEDIPMDQRLFPVQERSHHVSPLLFDVEMEFYAARIHKKDGRVIDIQPQFTFEKKRMKRGSETTKWFRYHFKHTQLEKGDLLEVHYKYEVPYQKNVGWFNSFRILSNSYLPRQHFDLEFAYNKGNQHKILGVESDTASRGEDYLVHNWTFKNRDGDVLYPNTRVYEREKHVTIGLNDYADWLYNNRSVAGFRDYVPRYITSLRQDYSNVEWLFRLAQKRFYLDRQTRWIKQFVERTTGHMHDSLQVQKALAIHDKIRRDFKWYNDFSWYTNKDLSKTNMGTQVKEEFMKNRSRTSLYTRLFFEVNAPVLYVRPMDKRIGEMTPRYFGPLWRSPTLFALPEGRRIHYVYPKSAYLNLYANEIPFYWEGTHALLINPFELFSRHEMPMRMVTFPGSTEKENRRKTDIKVVVNSESNSGTIQSRVRLSGQFSTLTRSVYRDESIDSTISTLYHDELFEENRSVVTRRVEEKTASEIYPFVHAYHLDYLWEPNIMTVREDTMVLVLEDWINPIIENCYGNLTYTYYPDFQYQDNFSCLIHIQGGQVVSKEKEEILRFGNSSVKVHLKKVSRDKVLARVEVSIRDNHFKGDQLPKLMDAKQMLAKFDQLKIEFLKSGAE